MQPWGHIMLSVGSLDSPALAQLAANPWSIFLSPSSLLSLPWEISGIPLRRSILRGALGSPSTILYPARKRSPLDFLQHFSLPHYGGGILPLTPSWEFSPSLVIPLFWLASGTHRVPGLARRIPPCIACLYSIACMGGLGYFFSNTEWPAGQKLKLCSCSSQDSPALLSLLLFLFHFLAPCPPCLPPSHPGGNLQILHPSLSTLPSFLPSLPHSALLPWPLPGSPRVPGSAGRSSPLYSMLV